LSAIIIVWVFISYYSISNLNEPDGKARITGKCGDTMEIYLKFHNGKVIDTSYWTDGCLYSYNSLCAAAELAKGKTPDEIAEIDAKMIKDYIGGLPSDHIHCAQLAEETLQAALNDYMIKITKQTKEQSPAKA